MSVETVSVKKKGRDYKISPHFTLGEFASKDGSDTVLYATELLDKLEELRAYVGGKIVINSGYRSKKHNKAVGGATGSYHTKGYAADIVVIKGEEDVSAKLICCLCQTLGFKGIGLINDSAVHVDMRPKNTYRGDERKGYANNVKNGDFYTYFGISHAQIEAMKAPEEAKATDVPAEGSVVKMTKAEFRKMYLEMEAEVSGEDPGAWSEEARKWAEKTGIIHGTGAGMAYRSHCTREQIIVFLYRFYCVIKNLIDAKKE